MTRYQTIVLHAGLHKTGTTSLQTSCFRQRELLQQHGITYPVFHFRERQIFNHSDPLCGAISSLPGAYGMARRQGVEDDPGAARIAFAEQLDAILADPPTPTLLLSAEMVADFNAADMQALRQRLEDACDQLQVIAYVRSPRSSLASILQQRALAGGTAAPRDLVNLVRRRYQALRRGFGELLQVHDFHRAVAAEQGLAGHFFRTLGLPSDKLAELDSGHANQRISTEAYRLIRAINQSYPPDGEERHGVKRQYHDLRALATLPGRPFRLDLQQDPELETALASETSQLERELGWEFPEPAAAPAEALWQPPTLLALEAAVSKLEDTTLRQRAAAALVEEAALIQGQAPETAAILRFIKSRLDSQGELPRELVLEKLGADYFKFAALQFERASPETALYLMSLAGELRPDAAFIEERIRHYREKLGGS